MLIPVDACCQYRKRKGGEAAGGGLQALPALVQGSQRQFAEAWPL